ncbi:hypothetical protein CPT_Seabear_095 [Salmonella phage Seabear]|nr:hypothetical protein CPT_Seabear_095 [Salmonella phage Seabear]
MVMVLPCHGRECGFESHRSRQFLQDAGIDNHRMGSVYI